MSIVTSSTILPYPRTLPWPLNPFGISLVVKALGVSRNLNSVAQVIHSPTLAPLSGHSQTHKSLLTSESLRASTRVSSGFALFRHSSPSFGSQHICSYSKPSQKIQFGRWCSLRIPPAFTFIVHPGLPPKYSQIC